MDVTVEEVEGTGLGKPNKTNVTTSEHFDRDESAHPKQLYLLDDGAYGVKVQMVMMLERGKKEPMKMYPLFPSLYVLLTMPQA